MDRIGLPLPWGIVPAEVIRRTIAVPDPAAGAQWSVAVPGGVIWRILAGRGQFVTSAAARNREVGITYTDGSAEFCRSWTMLNQAASSSFVYGFFPMAGTVGFGYGNIGISFPIPDLALYPGSVVSSVVVNMDANDFWQGVVLAIDEYQVRGLERAAERYARAVAEAVGAGG